ncbi:MAG TPA: peptidoglycan DD-metalloendopeptidase family protein, partial [Azospira sp.]|nr:peptidoglycan DD-metalloendopeptidase family protein [Azospira sp.]
PGGVAVLKLGPAATAMPAVSFGALPQPVLRERGQWVALIGIPLDSPAGPAEALVETAGEQRVLRFEIRAKHYPTQQLRIPDQRLVEPPPELAMRIAAEQQRLNALKRHFSDADQPETDFALPATGRLSSRFGVRRVLNGQPRSPHSGLDLALASGHPVGAPAAGTVLAVEDFYFAGSTVVVDHGRGVLTLYAHLSRVDVAVGQRLRRGEAIGRSGASGRATGPHLHWVVVVGGSSVDPELFLAPRR